MIQPRLRKRDGRRVYDVRLRDPGGKEYSRTFLTRREAQAFEVTERTNRLSNSWIDSRLAKTPLATVAEDWLESDARKRARSIERDRGILANHILPVLGSKPVGAISRADVQRLVRSWTGRYAASTVGRHYSTLRAVLAYAEASELIVRSPCRHIPLPQATPREAEILDADGLERLAAAMGSCGPMIYLAALGLRWGEIAGLRVGRLDFLRQTLTVAVQQTRGEGGRMVEQDPKTAAGRRTITVPDWVMTMLAEHLAVRGVTGSDRGGWVFVSPEGQPLHYNNWRRRVWVPAVAAAGFEGLTFHDLKHTAGTTLVEEGVNVKTAQARLGHANPQTTLRIYAQATDRADRQAAERIGERFRPRDGRGMEAVGPQQRQTQ